MTAAVPLEGAMDRNVGAFECRVTFIRCSDAPGPVYPVTSNCATENKFLSLMAVMSAGPTFAGSLPADIAQNGKWQLKSQQCKHSCSYSDVKLVKLRFHKCGMQIRDVLFAPNL